MKHHARHRARSEIDLDDLLRTEPNDLGCDASAALFDQFADATVFGMSPERLFPEVAAHVRACAACREDVAGLIEAVSVLGDPRPPVTAPDVGRLTISVYHDDLEALRPLPGQAAPPLHVPELSGGWFVLASRRPDVFTMIVFFRGLHCPICHAQLHELDRRVAELGARGIEIIAISAETLERSRQLAKEWEIKHLNIGYGLPERMMRAWGLFLSRGRFASEPPLFNEPGLFLVDRESRIYYEAVVSMPVGRPRLTEVLRAIDNWNKTG